MRANDGTYSLSIRGVLAVRERVTFLPGGRPVVNDLGVQRARVIFLGNIFSPNIQYYLALGTALFDNEIAAGVPLYEAYFASTHLRDFSVRVGQFFIPVSRLSQTSTSQLEFVDRPFAYGELNTDRDVGVMVYSNNFLGLNRIQYYAGIFSGKGIPNGIPPRTPSGREISFQDAIRSAFGVMPAFRLQFTPLGTYEELNAEGDLSRSSRPRLSVGVSGAYNYNTNRQGSTIGRAGPSVIDYAHWTADLTFRVSGFSFAGEFLYREAYSPQSRLLPSSVIPAAYSDEDRVPFNNRSLVAYYLQMGMILHPNVGIAARWEHSAPLHDTDPTLRLGLGDRGYAVTGALSGYIFQHYLKIQADYSYRFGPTALSNGEHILRVVAQSFL